MQIRYNSGVMPIRRATEEDFKGLLSCEPFGLFYGASSETIATLLNSDSVKVQIFAAGDKMFEQGDDQPGAIWIVLNGVFAVLHRYEATGEGSESHSLIVALDTVGNVIGDVEYLIGDVPSELIPRGLNSRENKADIIALTPGEAIRIKGGAIQVALNDPAIPLRLLRLFALKLLRRSARGDAIILCKGDWAGVISPLLYRLAREPRLMGLGVSEITSEAVKESVADFARRPSVEERRTFIQLNCKMNQDHLATALGVSKQTVSRAFTKLEQDGIAAYRKEGILLVSREFIEGPPPKISW